MILATHAIAGAAVAQLFPQHPVFAFAAGFASHLALDSIPHWDYKVLSVEKDKNEPLNTDMVMGKKFIFDALRIGTDALAGLMLSIFVFFYFFHNVPLSITLIGAIAGMLPDPLQFVYWKTRSPFLLPLQKFHIWIHSKTSLKASPALGLSLQFLIIVAVVSIVMLMRRSL